MVDVGAGDMEDLRHIGNCQKRAVGLNQMGQDGIVGRRYTFGHTVGQAALSPFQKHKPLAIKSASCYTGIGSCQPLDFSIELSFSIHSSFSNWLTVDQYSAEGVLRPWGKNQEGIV